MEKLLFTLVLGLLAGVISVLTGRNRRQFQKVPEGMGIVYSPPGKRYVLYALGVLVLGVVLFFGVLYVLDGAPESARPMWGLCVAAAVLAFLSCIVGGNLLARECVYFDREKFQVNRAFRKPQVVQWHEVQSIRGDFDQEIRLYGADETKLLTVGIGLVNYEVFCKVLKKECPAAVAEYYRLRAQEQPQKCVLRYGAEYYLLAIMGLLMFGVYLALLISTGERNLFQSVPAGDWSKQFAVCFPLFCGVVSVPALFVLCTTKVKYSPEAISFRYPLRRAQEVPWRAIRQVEVVRGKKEGRIVWKKLRLYTEEDVYKLNLERLTSGKDGFLTMLHQVIEKYEIPCVEAGR